MLDLKKQPRERIQMRPLFVALEGIDGAGKSTLAAELKENLEALGVSVHVTRLVENTIALLKGTVDRSTGVAGSYQELVPDAERGELYAVEAYIVASQLKQRCAAEVVLFDRWFPIVGWNSGALPWDLGGKLPVLAYQELTKPELVIWLQIEPAIAADRLANRGDWMVKRYERSELTSVLTELHERHSKAWSGAGNVLTLDASRPIEQLVHLATDAVLWQLQRPQPLGDFGNI